jgi:hypothetical protein
MFSFLKNLFGGMGTKSVGLPPAWSFRDAEPIGEAYSQPDRVDYELDLSTWRYRLRAIFRNDAPFPTVHGKRAIRHVLYDTNWLKSFTHARLAVAMGDRGC